MIGRMPATFARGRRVHRVLLQRIPVNRKGYDARGRYHGALGAWSIVGCEVMAEAPGRTRREAAAACVPMARRVLHRALVDVAHVRAGRVDVGPGFAASLWGIAKDAARDLVALRRAARGQRAAVSVPA
jgi:hypothetical protein